MNRLIQIECKRLGRVHRPGGGDGARAGEEGFMLLAVVVMVALLLIALAVAAPVVARQLQRDKEIESQHRMEQYVRAIQLYQRKFPGQYPASVKVLLNTNNIRFLRQVYVDPLTGKADYKLIHQGEQKTKVHVFFGQELGGLAASLGSAAGMQSSGGVGASVGAGVGATGSTNVTSTNALNSGFGGATIGGSSGTAGTTGNSGTNSSSVDSLGSDSLGVIVGVGTSKSGTSITQPNGQTTYEAWEFWYDPRIEMLKQGVNVTGGGMTGGAPGSGMGSQSASSFGQNATSGASNSPTNSNGSNTFGGTNSTTSNPNSSVPNPF
jgi:type II secretory pathway pseudopilin PulG